MKKAVKPKNPSTVELQHAGGKNLAAYSRETTELLGHITDGKII